MNNQEGGGQEGGGQEGGGYVKAGSHVTRSMESVSLGIISAVANMQSTAGLLKKTGQQLESCEQQLESCKNALDALTKDAKCELFQAATKTIEGADYGVPLLKRQLVQEDQLVKKRQERQERERRRELIKALSAMSAKPVETMRLTSAEISEIHDYYKQAISSLLVFTGEPQHLELKPEELESLVTIVHRLREHGTVESKMIVDVANSSPFVHTHIKPSLENLVAFYMTLFKFCSDYMSAHVDLCVCGDRPTLSSNTFSKLAFQTQQGAQMPGDLILCTSHMRKFNELNGQFLSVTVYKIVPDPNRPCRDDDVYTNLVQTTLTDGYLDGLGRLLMLMSGDQNYDQGPMSPMAANEMSKQFLSRSHDVLWDDLHRLSSGVCACQNGCKSCYDLALQTHNAKASQILWPYPRPKERWNEGESAVRPGWYGRNLTGFFNSFHQRPVIDYSAYILATIVTGSCATDTCAVVVDSRDLRLDTDGKMYCEDCWNDYYMSQNHSRRHCRQHPYRRTY